MLRIPETTDRGVDNASGCDSHCLCLRFLLVARISNGCVMVARASGSGMGVCRVSRPQKGVGVLAMLDVRPDTMRHA